MDGEDEVIESGDVERIIRVGEKPLCLSIPKMVATFNSMAGTFSRSNGKKLSTLLTFVVTLTVVKIAKTGENRS